MLTTLDYMKIFHETKNSVTLINSSLQLIEKKHPDVAAYPLWKDTMQEVTYLKNLIAELSLSRTGYPLNLSLVAPADFIREISDAIHNLSFSQNFVCKTTLEENLPPIFIDSLRLKQALINLLKNSYEAMGETGTVILNVFVKMTLSTSSSPISAAASRTPRKTICLRFLPLPKNMAPDSVFLSPVRSSKITRADCSLNPVPVTDAPFRSCSRSIPDPDLTQR